MKIALVLIAVLAVAAVIALFALGYSSNRGKAPGLVDGRLARCPNTPNCVCSEYPDDAAHHVDAIALSGRSPESAMRALESIVTRLGGKPKTTRGHYLAATFSSALFGFIDDVEFRVDPESGLVQLRSASRVGRGDLGVNRERVDAIRRLFEEIPG